MDPLMDRAAELRARGEFESGKATITIKALKLERARLQHLIDDLTIALDDAKGEIARLQTLIRFEV